MTRRIIALAAIAIVTQAGSCTPAQQQAAIGLAVQTGVSLATALGGPQAAAWVAAGGLICNVGGKYVAALGTNVAGTAAADMQAVCNGLGGTGTALPVGTDLASVLTAIKTAAKAS